jgi:hypothetical protein
MVIQEIITNSSDPAWQQLHQEEMLGQTLAIIFIVLFLLGAFILIVKKLIPDDRNE